MKKRLFAEGESVRDLTGEGVVCEGLTVTPVQVTIGVEECAVVWVWKFSNYFRCLEEM